MPDDRFMLDVLAKTADDWREMTQALLTVTLGLVMEQLEVTSIDIRVDPEVTETLLDIYDLDRHYYTANNETYMRVTMKRKEVKNVDNPVEPSGG